MELTRLTKQQLDGDKEFEIVHSYLHADSSFHDDGCLISNRETYNNLQIDKRNEKKLRLETSLVVLFKDANLGKEGVILVFAVVYLLLCKAGNECEVSTAFRLLAMATCFATKMIPGIEWH